MCVSSTNLVDALTWLNSGGPNQVEPNCGQDSLGLQSKEITSKSKSTTEKSVAFVSDMLMLTSFKSGPFLNTKQNDASFLKRFTRSSITQNMNFYVQFS